MKTFSFLRNIVLLLGFVVIGLCGCRKNPVPGPDDNKDDVIEMMENQCGKMNVNIASFQKAVTAVSGNDYVTSAGPMTDAVGYEISFAESGTVVIWTDVAPLVAVKNDGGTYVWTLGGEYMRSGDGGKIPVADVKPQLKVEDAKWKVSCDGGKSWTEAEAPGEEEKIEVTQDDDKVCVAFNGENLILPKNPAFVFTINDVTAASVKFDIDVADDQMRYTIMSVEKSYADQFADDEALFQDDMEYFIGLWNDAYEAYETLDEVIMDYTAVGDCAGLMIEGLEPETEYLFYAYGLELDGTRTTAIHREYITTKAVEKTDMTFEIDAVVDGLLIDVAVTPGSNDVYYYFDAIEKRSVDIDFGGDVAAAAKYYIDYNVMVGTYYGMTTEEVMLELASKGPDHYVFECAPTTEYIIFAMAVSLDGNVISELSTKSVVTGEITPSDNVITVNVDAVTSTVVTVSTTTTNGDPYFLGIEPVSKFRGMNDEQIMETVCAEYGEYIDWSTEYGNVDKLELVDLQPDTEYLLMAFGVQYSYPTTSLLKMTVKTESGGNPAECTFDIQISGITETSADVVVTPSADDVRFFSGGVEAGISDEVLMSEIREEIKKYIEAGEVSSSVEFWQYMTVIGVDMWTATELVPGTDYEIIAVPIDMAAGDFVAPFTRKAFTTLGTAPASKAAAPEPMKLYGQQKKPAAEKAAPMRKIDFRNMTHSSEPGKKTVRRSAFSQKRINFAGTN